MRMPRVDGIVTRSTGLIAIDLVAILFLDTSAVARPDEICSLKEDKAETNMMCRMDFKPTGIVDRDFAEMMILNHQHAIDMAQIELRDGHNEQMQKIAQTTITELQQEIAAIRLAFRQSFPSDSPASDQIKAR